MKRYNFTRLINKYAVNCQLVTFAEGKWEGGEWQEGQKNISDISGAVVPISEKRVQNSGGSYQQGDLEFITTQSIEITSDTYLVYHGKHYKLMDTTDYSEYADFHTYLAKGVSVFDSTRNDTKNNDS